MRKQRSHYLLHRAFISYEEVLLHSHGRGEYLSAIQKKLVKSKDTDAIQSYRKQAFYLVSDLLHLSVDEFSIDGIQSFTSILRTSILLYNTAIDREFRLVLLLLSMTDD